MRYGRVIRRRTGNGRLHGGLFDIQIFKFLAEIVFSGGSKAVLPVSHEVQIDVHRENLLFCVEPSDLNRKHGFLNLSAESSFRRQEQVLAQLLSQRTATLDYTAGHNILQTSPSNAVEINTPMCEEVLVFNRSDCVFDHLRDFVPGNDHASLESKASDDLAVVGIDFRYKTRMVVFERVHLRQIAVVHEKDTRCSTECDGQTQQENKDQRAKITFELRFHAVRHYSRGARLQLYWAYRFTRLIQGQTSKSPKFA